MPITANRDMNSVVPKATIYVGTEPDPAPAPDPRAGTLDVGSGPSTGTLVLLGRVAAVGGLLLVGGLTVLAGSGRSKPTPEPQPRQGLASGTRPLFHWRTKPTGRKREFCQGHC